jgi:hypothetical protein
VRVGDLGSGGEQRVRLVQEQHGLGALGDVEDRGEVLLGLTEPLGDDLGDVDHQQVGRGGRGEGLGGQ